VKKLVKLIVTSEAYQQSSQFSVRSAQLDPMNTWLSRGPRHRLSAEVIRDQALAASGLLVEKIGGPSVKPYHPPGLYEQVVAQRDNPKATYQQGSGDDLHRRSLYTYWKRSVPHPGMLLFDAPFRETCALRRSRSNTPLQALNLLNDPTYVEAARFLAQRMIKEGGTTIEKRLTHGFRLLLGRNPSPQELRVLAAAIERSSASAVSSARHDAFSSAVSSCACSCAAAAAAWAFACSCSSTAHVSASLSSLPCSRCRSSHRTACSARTCSRAPR
jgi:hypothetical protein